MKPASIIFIGSTALALLLCLGACTKSPPAQLPSARFAGNFSGNEICLLNGNQTDTLHITATGASQISIANLYGLPKSTIGNVSNDSCVIVAQLDNNYVIQGLLVLHNDTIMLSLIATSFGREDKCTAILVKQ